MEGEISENLEEEYYDQEGDEYQEEEEQFLEGYPVDLADTRNRLAKNEEDMAGVKEDVASLVLMVREILNKAPDVIKAPEAVKVPEKETSKKSKKEVDMVEEESENEGDDSDSDASVTKIIKPSTSKHSPTSNFKTPKKSGHPMSPTPLKVNKNLGRGKPTNLEGQPTMLRQTQNFVKNIEDPSIKNIRNLISQLKAHEYSNQNYPISIATYCSLELKNKVVREMRQKYPMMEESELVNYRNSEILEALAQIQAPENEEQWLTKIRAALVFPPLVAWQKQTKSFMAPSETVKMVDMYSEYLTHCKEILQYTEAFWKTDCQVASRPPTFRPQGGYDTAKTDNVMSCIIEGDTRKVLMHFHDLHPPIATRKLDTIYEYLEKLWTRLHQVKQKAVEYSATFNLLSKMSTMAIPDPKGNSKEDNVKITQSAWNNTRSPPTPNYKRFTPRATVPEVAQLEETQYSGEDVEEDDNLEHSQHMNEPAYQVAEISNTPAKPKRACLLMLSGECKKGNECTFSHDKDILIAAGRGIKQNVERMTGIRRPPTDTPRNTKVYQSQPVAEMEPDEAEDMSTYTSPYMAKRNF